MNYILSELLNDILTPCIVYLGYYISDYYIFGWKEFVVDTAKAIQIIKNM